MYQGSNTPIAFKLKDYEYIPTMVNRSAVLSSAIKEYKTWAHDDVQIIDGYIVLPQTSQETAQYDTGSLKLEFKFFDVNKKVEIVQGFNVPVLGRRDKDIHFTDEASLDIDPAEVYATEVMTDTHFIGGETGVYTVNRVSPIDGNVTVTADDIEVSDGLSITDELANKQDKINTAQATAESAGATAVSAKTTADQASVVAVAAQSSADTAVAEVEALPVWSKQPTKPTYTASEVGALPDTTVIPSKLPNPQLLTFTGAVTGSYDGSTALTVNIPSGGGSSENGATFTPVPTVDGNTLNLSWTNNKSLPNPTPVDVIAPKGDKGDKGEQGQQGIKGDTGQQGDKGDAGEQGLKGDPFIYDDFTPEQLAGLKGEKGDTGAKGDKGDKGDTGEKGTDGTNGTNGADATINGVSTINIVAGANVSITQEGDTLTVSATGGSGGGSRVENVLWENAEGVGNETTSFTGSTFELTDNFTNYDELIMSIAVYDGAGLPRYTHSVVLSSTIQTVVAMGSGISAVISVGRTANNNAFWGRIGGNLTTDSSLDISGNKLKIFKITGVKYNANPADYNVEPYSVYALNQMGVIPAETEEERQQQLNELGVY